MLPFMFIPGFNNLTRHISTVHRKYDPVLPSLPSMLPLPLFVFPCVNPLASANTTAYAPRSSSTTSILGQRGPWTTVHRQYVRSGVRVIPTLLFASLAKFPPNLPPPLCHRGWKGNMMAGALNGVLETVSWNSELSIWFLKRRFPDELLIPFLISQRFPGGLSDGVLVSAENGVSSSLISGNWVRPLTWQKSEFFDTKWNSLSHLGVRRKKNPSFF